MTPCEYLQSMERQHQKWWVEGSPRRKQIHRVQPLLRLKHEKMNDHIYDPTIVSIGPYHHGKPELNAAEQLKYIYLNRFVSSENEKFFLYNKILEHIDDIRGCYAENLDKYTDNALALMMLLDACFILTFFEGVKKEGNIYMETGEEIVIDLESTAARDERSIFSDWHRCLGRCTLGVVTRDLMVLENQIPFYVINLIINEEDKAEGKDQLPRKFLNWILFRKIKLDKIPGEIENPPLHLLDALHGMIGGEEISPNYDHNPPPIHVLEQQKQPDPSLHKHGPTHTKKQHTLITFLELRNKQIKKPPKEYHISWSVMDLRAKGVSFMRNKSESLRDIKLIKSGVLYGVTLYLPSMVVSPISLNILANLIAYEMSPDSDTNYECLSHSNFMKSLIESTEDVQELQEKNILINLFHNQEQVVEVFKGIETFGLNNFGILNKVRKEIGEHCQNKCKTMLAEFIHTRFRYPWSVIGSLAGTLVIILTFIQTYFAIHQKKP